MIKKETDYKSWGDNIREISVLQGQTIVDVVQTSDEITFETSEGCIYKMFHAQDCCESVYIESIVGDLTDLIGQEIILAEERYSSEKQEWKVEESEYPDDSFTWTFYTIRTLKTSIDIRWYGYSNGYYSESAEFIRIK
jgi:hypothetical protein